MNFNLVANLGGKLIALSLPGTAFATFAQGAVNIVASPEATRAELGTARALARNATLGAATAHRKRVEISGAGARFALEGQALACRRGGSSEWKTASLPAGAKVEIDAAGAAIFSGADKQAVGQAAANALALAPWNKMLGYGARIS
jgi:ribosomal protein L6P/L9E